MHMSVGQVTALNLVSLSSRAVDVYKAAATAYAFATVYSSTVSGSNAFNLTSYIDRGLSTALNAGDADLLGRTIALSASSFASSINCTIAPPQVDLSDTSTSTMNNNATVSLTNDCPRLPSINNNSIVRRSTAMHAEPTPTSPTTASPTRAVAAWTPTGASWERATARAFTSWPICAHWAPRAPDTANVYSTSVPTERKRWSPKRSCPLRPLPLVHLPARLSTLSLPIKGQPPLATRSRQ